MEVFPDVTRPISPPVSPTFVGKASAPDPVTASATSANEITIDPYTFTVHEVVDIIGSDRIFARITNTFTLSGQRYTVNFACYRSSSDLGLWRFSTIIDKMPALNIVRHVIIK